MIKTLSLVVVLGAGCFGVEYPAAAAASLRAKHVAEMTAAAVGWLKAADLGDVPVPEVSADPRASETKAAGDAREHNGRLSDLRKLQADLTSGNRGKVIMAEQEAYRWFSALPPPKRTGGR